jgi:hypothetical protein
MRFSKHTTALLPVLALFGLTACNDEPDFGFDEWEAQVDTVTLYSVDRPEHQGLPAAYDIRATRTLRIEDPSSTGNWDFALTGGAGGELTLTPLGAFFDVANNAGVATVTDQTFEELESAPADAERYVVDESVTIEADVVYVIRSRQGGNCMNFAKLEPLEVDTDGGTFTFQLTANPTCNDRALVPPEDD